VRCNDFGAACLLPEFECSLVERLGLRVAALGAIEVGEVVEGSSVPCVAAPGGPGQSSAMTLGAPIEPSLP
jgi:hypothetical protein